MTEQQLLLYIYGRLNPVERSHASHITKVARALATKLGQTPDKAARTVLRERTTAYLKCLEDEPITAPAPVRTPLADAA